MDTHEPELEAGIQSERASVSPVLLRCREPGSTCSSRTGPSRPPPSSFSPAPAHPRYVRRSSLDRRHAVRPERALPRPDASGSIPFVVPRGERPHVCKSGGKAEGSTSSHSTRRDGPPVAATRRLYRLPYFLAEMAAGPSDDGVSYRSRRVDERGHEAELVVRYRSTGPVAVAEPGSLEHFLAERYCLYTINERGEPLRAEIHHPPRPLQSAEATIDVNTMVPPVVERPTCRLYFTSPPVRMFSRGRQSEFERDVAEASARPRFPLVLQGRMPAARPRAGGAPP
jgi:hypothetical protein